MNPNASRHSRYLELHFNDRGRISSAKVLTYGLDKSRLNHLTHEERSFHVFYQFIAGATPAERDAFNLEDPSDYALLASSGTYRLPAGPFSDDSIGMSELRAAMRTLGFKQKHMTSIFSLLVAILLLGNLQFAEGDFHDVSAHTANVQILDQAARLLGVPAEDLNQVLTNRSSYVRKELFTVLLSGGQSSAQRDQCVRDLYAVLFAFIVETANHRLAPSSKDPAPSTQIILLDQPGFQSRGPGGTSSMSLTGKTPLVSVYGQNGFDEFCINFADEFLHSYITRHIFEDTVGYNGQMSNDGVTLPAIATMTNGACVELLRGALLNERALKKPGGLLGVINKADSAYKTGKGGDNRNDDLLQELATTFGVHASFVASPGVGGVVDKTLFGINHYAGSPSYDVTNFIERDTDLVDSAFVTILRNSTDPFVAKLMSGPSLATERHNKDDNIIVQAQASSRPLRQPTPILSPEKQFPPSSEDHAQLDPNKTYPVTAQLNFTLSEIFTSLDRARLWTISCIRPNDSGSPNSFDKRRVKSQIRALLLPDIASRRSVDFVADLDMKEFCDRYVPTMRGSEIERITQCARANGWNEGIDYVIGHRMMWLAYPAWKTVEDILRTSEKSQKNNGDEEGSEEYAGDDGTDFTHQTDGLAPQGGYFGGSGDNLLLTRTGTDGERYQDANADYGAQGTPRGVGEVPWNEYDKKGGHGGSPQLPTSTKEVMGIVVKVSQNTVEAVPSSRSRRVWLFMVWATTWFIPSFLLRTVGRMKRPDVRLAWREKVTIVWIIFLINAIVIFYIVEFGRLLCPNFDKAWSPNEVLEHQGDNDYWVSVQGVVYDVSNFVHGDHSDIQGIVSNGPDTLESLAGSDMTDYFPPPLNVGCNGLVTDNTISLSRQNFTLLAPTAMHVSGNLQTTSKALSSPDWYPNVFFKKMQTFRKGPLVYPTKQIAAMAADPTVAK